MKVEEFESYIMSRLAKITSDGDKNLLNIRGFSMLRILKNDLHILFYLIPMTKILFMHSLIHSLFNSYINIYRLVNYVLSFVRCAQYTVIRHTNKQRHKQTKLSLFTLMELHWRERF